MAGKDNVAFVGGIVSALLALGAFVVGHVGAAILLLVLSMLFAFALTKPCKED